MRSPSKQGPEQDPAATARKRVPLRQKVDTKHDRHLQMRGNSPRAIASEQISTQDLFTAAGFGPLEPLEVDELRAALANDAWRKGRVSPDQLVRLFDIPLEELIENEEKGQFGPLFVDDTGALYWLWENVGSHVNLVKKVSTSGDKRTIGGINETISAFKRHLHAVLEGPHPSWTDFPEPAPDEVHIASTIRQMNPQQLTDLRRYAFDMLASGRDDSRPQTLGTPTEQFEDFSSVEDEELILNDPNIDDDLPSGLPIAHTEGAEAEPAQATDRLRDYRGNQIPDEKLAFIAANLHRYPSLVTRLYNGIAADLSKPEPRGIDGRLVPTVAPVLWASVGRPARRGKDYISPATFLIDTYGNWLDAGVFGEDNLALLDPDLLASYKDRLTHYPTERVKALKRPRSKAEREADELAPLISREDVQRIGRALSQRAHRASKRSP